MAVPTLRLEYWRDVFRTQYSSTPSLQSFSCSSRVFPASGRCNSLVDFTRSPGTGLVFVDWRAGLQHRVDDAPGLFHIVLPGKQGGVSRHGVTEHAFVSIHLLRAGIAARQQLHLFTNHPLFRIHHRHTEGSRDVRTDAESEIVLCARAGRKDDGRLVQADDDLGARYWQRLPGPDVERHALPAPGIHAQLQSGEGFDFRIRRHAVFLAVATKLPANKILCLQRPNSLQDLNLFVADRFTIGSHRWLHRQVHQNLEQVILNHVADRAGLIVERPPALNSEVFCHGNLYALDLIAVPKRLQNCILEA